MGCKGELVELVKGGGLVLKIIIKKNSNRKIKLCVALFLFVCLLVNVQPPVESSPGYKLRHR